jgi:hypothetical protein
MLRLADEFKWNRSSRKAIRGDLVELAQHLPWSANAQQLASAWSTIRVTRGRTHRPPRRLRESAHAALAAGLSGYGAEETAVLLSAIGDACSRDIDKSLGAAVVTNGLPHAASLAREGKLDPRQAARVLYAAAKLAHHHSGKTPQVEDVCRAFCNAVRTHCCM